MSYPGGHAGFLAIAIATHGAVGYVLGAVLFDRPYAGAVGALAPDVDFLFPAALEWPFVHRGITHTLPAVALVVGLAAARGRIPAKAVAAGYASHLLLDVTTPAGVPVLYPLVSERLYLDLPTTGHSPVPTVALWACCLFLAWRYHRGPRVRTGERPAAASD